MKRSLFSDKWTGPYLILIAAFLFACMNLGVRLLKDFPPDVLILYRSLFQILVLSPGIRHFLPKDRNDLQRKLLLHFGRGLFGVTSMIFLYASMQKLPLGLASLLTMTNVFWATLFSWIFLKETLHRKQLLWAGVSLVGIGIALFHPGQFHNLSADLIGIFCGLIAGAAAGTAYTILRSIRKTVPTTEIVFYFGCLGVLITAPLAALHFRWPSTPREVLLLFYISICATLAQLFMTQGFKDTTASLASLVNLQQTTFSVVLGMVFLNEWPDTLFFVGAATVLLGLRNLILRGPKA